MWQEKIRVDGPYDFDLALSRLAMDPLNRIDAACRKIEVPIYGDKPEVAIVQACGTTTDPAFLVSGKFSYSKDQVIRKVSRIFQWETPLASVHDHFSKTALQSLFEQHWGTPIVLDFSPYCTLMKSIIHQQINMKFAISLTEEFVRKFGYEVDGVPFYPSPEKVAGLETAALREMRFSQRKAEYLIGLAEKMADGELDLENLAKLDDQEVIKRLVKLRGVGPWTAQNFLLFGLGRANLFPAADIGIQNALKKLFALDRKPTMEEMEQYSAEWQPYLSYASLYLWRSIEPTE